MLIAKSKNTQRLFCNVPISKIMNTGSQEEYQVTLFITGRAQNVEQLENCEICTKSCGKTVSIDTNRQGCEKDVIWNQITIFSGTWNWQQDLYPVNSMKYIFVKELV